MRTWPTLVVLSLSLAACGSVSNTDPDGGGGGGGGGDAASDNRPPTVDSIDAPETIEFGETVALTCNASDEDGDTLTFTWTAGAGDIVGNGSEVALDASDAVEGAADITCKVEDGRGGEDEMTVGSRIQVADGDLIARYEFDGDTTDSSGNGHDGTPAGDPQFVADRFGADGAAIELDGDADLVVLADGNHFDLTTFTITAWIQVGPYEFTRFLLNKPAGSSHGNYGLKLLGSGANAPDGLEVIHKDPVTGSGFDALVTDGAIPRNQWVHIAVTADPDHLAGYVDGAPGAEVPDPPARTLSDDDVNIGNDGNNEQFYDGDIDDLRFYSRVLTADEIAAIAGNR